MTEQQKVELTEEIQKAEKTLELMKQNAEKISDKDTKQMALKNVETFEKHIEHMKNMLKEKIEKVLLGPEF